MNHIFCLHLMLQKIHLKTGSRLFTNYLISIVKAYLGGFWFLFILFQSSHIHCIYSKQKSLEHLSWYFPGYRTTEVHTALSVHYYWSLSLERRKGVGTYEFPLNWIAKTDREFVQDFCKEENIWRALNKKRL